MSGIDEQTRIGIRCDVCKAQGSFVYSDEYRKLDFHIHGMCLYISSNKNTPLDSEMLRVPVGESPGGIIRNTEWTDCITRGRESNNNWVCKNCDTELSNINTISTRDAIGIYIGGYYFYDMIYIGEKETMDKLYGYESERNVRD